MHGWHGIGLPVLMGRALDGLTSGLTMEHLWWLSEIEQGRGTDVPDTLRRDLEARGYVASSENGTLKLTHSGERAMRMSAAAEEDTESSAQSRENLGRNAASREGARRSRRR